jgi:1,2-phenylacetyl-CoA epoxidase catalytic subunit
VKVMQKTRVQKSVLDEEARAILRRIVESLAWRQLAVINILGHGLKFVTELDVKLRVVGELDRALELFQSVRALYGELGWTDLESAVRERAQDVPYPESRLEFGVAYYVSGLTEEVAMQSFVESAYAPFAAIAKKHVEAAAQRPEPTRFLEYCSDPANRPHAQELLDRWVLAARRAFGRADSPHDAKALALGLKNRRSAELDRIFCQRLQPFLASCGLELTALEG